MRADAEANRERVLDAAAAVFAERGIDAPLGLISERAEVGKGTLYRHFPDRDSLIIGLAARLAGRYAAIAAAAASAPTGWDAIVTYVDGVTAMYLDLPWMVVVRARSRRLIPPDDRFEQAMLMVIERARVEGSLRTDVDPADLALVPSSLSGLVDLPEPLRSGAIARQRDIILDGLRTEGAPRPPLGSKPIDVERFRQYIARTEPAEAP